MGRKPKDVLLPRARTARRIFQRVLFRPEVPDSYHSTTVRIGESTRSLPVAGDRDSLPVLVPVCPNLRSLG
jgi:hypothetical protein